MAVKKIENYDKPKFKTKKPEYIDKVSVVLIIKYQGKEESVSVYSDISGMKSIIESYDAIRGSGATLIENTIKSVSTNPEIKKVGTFTASKAGNNMFVFNNKTIDCVEIILDPYKIEKDYSITDTVKSFGVFVRYNDGLSASYEIPSRNPNKVFSNMFNKLNEPPYISYLHKDNIDNPVYIKNSNDTIIIVPSSRVVYISIEPTYYNQEELFLAKVTGELKDG